MKSNFDNNNGKSYEFGIESCRERLQRRGIVAVHTELKQFPCADNGNMSIVRCKLEDRDGHRFSWLGASTPFSADDDPSHIRDSIGEAARHSFKGALSMAEACFPADTSPTPQPAPPQTAQPQQQAFTKSHATPRGPRQGQQRHHRTEPGSMSGSQRNVVSDIAKQHGMTLEEIFQTINTTPENASSYDANVLIQQYRS